MVTLKTMVTLKSAFEKVSDAFSIGSFTNAARDFVDVDTLKQVEVYRGPASASPSLPFQPIDASCASDSGSVMIA